MKPTRGEPVHRIPPRILSRLNRPRRARSRANAFASGTPKRRNREGDAPSERRPRDALLMPFMAGNAVAGAAATRVAGALRRTPTVGIAVVMAAMENIVLVLVLRESPSSVARRCASGAFRDRRVYPPRRTFWRRVDREINPRFSSHGNETERQVDDAIFGAFPVTISGNELAIIHLATRREWFWTNHRRPSNPAALVLAPRQTVPRVPLKLARDTRDFRTVSLRPSLPMLAHARVPAADDRVLALGEEFQDLSLLTGVGCDDGDGGVRARASERGAHGRRDDARLAPVEVRSVVVAAGVGLLLAVPPIEKRVRAQANDEPVRHDGLVALERCLVRHLRGVAQTTPVEKRARESGNLGVHAVLHDERRRGVRARIVVVVDVAVISLASR